jgi:DNA-binding transcriptional regulator YiaG
VHCVDNRAGALGNSVHAPMLDTLRRERASVMRTPKRPIDPTIGKRLRELREHRGVSQQELGKAIGVTAGTIQHWERRRCAIGTVYLAALARALQCEDHDLLMEPATPMPRYRWRRTA